MNTFFGIFRLLKKVCFLLAVTWIGYSSWGAGMVQYNSRVWQTDEGLPQNSVHAITQTRDGYLWVGTQRGLARFNGGTFTVFDRRNVPGWADDWVEALCEDRHGNLWIGLHDGRLTKLKDGLFTHVSQPTRANSDARVLTVFECSKGIIWIGMRNGVQQFKDGKLTSFESEVLDQSSVRSICEDKNGVMWFGTTSGLYRFDEASGEVRRANEIFPKSFLRIVYFDRNNVLWTAPSRGGLHRIESGKTTIYDKVDGLGDNNVSAIYQDRKGTLWIGSYGGLNRLVNGTLIAEVDENGSAYDLISTFYEDREGNLWLGAKDGLYRLNPKQFNSYTTQHGLAHNNIMSVLEDRDGHMWFATWGGGLHQLVNGNPPVFARSPGRNRGADLLLGLTQTRDGALWGGADFEAGLFRFEQDKVTRFSKEHGLRGHAIRVLHEDREGRLWIGMTEGLTVLESGRFHDITNGIGRETIRAICETRDKGLWLGTESGLFRVVERGGMMPSRIEMFGKSGVASLYEDNEGVVWIGTFGAGLHRFKGGVFKAITTRDGMFDDSAHEILEDNRGHFWMSCRNGVYRVNKAELNEFFDGRVKTVGCVSYGRADGLGSTECNSVAKPAGWKSRDGRVWFATSKGLVVTDPNVDVPRNDILPPVIIERVVADKVPFVTPGTTTIDIAPGRGELVFHYAALSFRAPEKNRFKYKLEGVDLDWVEAGGRRAAFYNNIPPGTYRFHVIGSNNDGVWNGTGSSVIVNLQPHFLQTWWFQIAAVAVMGTGVFTGYRVRQNRKREIERLRLRIAADLHDDIGSNLASIALLSDMEKSSPELSEIHRIALTTATNVREIVWFINPDYDTLPEMIVRMKDVASTMLQGVRYEFKSPADPGSLKLPLDFRRNMFLVFKEVLHNIVKHANATAVRIDITEQRGGLQVQISDNGQGFDLKTVAGGNGLRNMRLRLEQLGGTFDISTAPGKGTVVAVSVRITQLRDTAR